ncbi:MAG: FAD-dependent oxidoreductase [Betaproteobacteria bacterium]|nr:MAG: FAD-dependent oxidoreductase [Betaproteobacteria bacterium]
MEQSMKQSYQAIFNPGSIGRLTAKNRLVLPAIVHNYADNAGHATPRYLAHIERIARGGVGTIILEASFVRQEGKGFLHQLGIHDDGVIPGLRALAESAHRHGALIGIQLFHGGRQASTRTSGLTPVAPSAIPDPVVNELPHELTLADISEIIAAFAAAAQRAKMAGLDFVELHGAHGYLIAQFLSSFSNRRQDAYGGTPEKRRRFLEEVYAAVRDAVGADFPITVRLSGVENVPDGLTIEQTAATAQKLEQLGAAALHISCGNYATYAQGTMIPPMAIGDGVLVPLAERIKKSVRIPVIAVGKIRTPAMALEVLEQGKADFIALGRSLLADPDWPIKVAAGELADVRHCIACNQGCISRLFAQETVLCTINPETGREAEFAGLHGGNGRKVLVVGGGPAGMAAARWGALAGFDVSLHEARSVLGGQLIAAAAAPHREGWESLREYLVHELSRLGVKVHLDSAMDAAGVARANPWAVIVASGAEPLRPEIPGWKGMPVAAGRDILEGSAAHQGHVVVAGGGCSGAQTAEYLASVGHEVTVIEAEGDIAIDAPVDERALMLARLQQHGVKLMPNTRLINATAGGVVVASPHETRTLPADMVVMCLGAKSVNEFARTSEAPHLRSRVVGDAVLPRKVTEAVAEGAFAILDLLGVKLSPVVLQELQSGAPGN